MRTLLASYKIIFATFLLMSIVTNGLMYIDLYLTLRNPFYPRSRRAKKYFFILFIMLVLSLSVSSYTYSTQTFTLLVYDNNLYPLSLFMRVTIISFLISTVYVIPMIIWRLCQPGTSRSLRNKVIQRYLVYLLIFLLWHSQFLLY
jgi:hypothetical protein